MGSKTLIIPRAGDTDEMKGLLCYTLVSALLLAVVHSQVAYWAQWAEWSQWVTCSSAGCGHGKRTRTRTRTQSASTSVADSGVILKLGPRPRLRDLITVKSGDVEYHEM